MGSYDKHYKKENYFGNPNPSLVKFFKEYEPKGMVLDLGCGQGRNSLTLARLGFKVVGVDISKVGIDQMMVVAEKEKLNIKGIVADIFQFEITRNYDVVLLDSMFHFYKNDKKKEMGLLFKIINKLKPNGILCMLIIKTKTTESILDEILGNLKIGWEVLENQNIDYPEFNAKYRMMVTKKLK